MKPGLLLFMLTAFVSTQLHAETFFGVEIEKTASSFKLKNKKQITKCEDRNKFSSEIRFTSEITGKYDQYEDQTETIQVECKLQDDVTALFIKTGGEMILWKLEKTHLSKSILKIAKDLEVKVNAKVKIDSELVNENMGVQYTFRTSFAGGEIRGRAVSPYSKRSPDEVTMEQSGSVDLVLTTPLKQAFAEVRRKENELKSKEKSKVNSGESGI